MSLSVLQNAQQLQMLIGEGKAMQAFEEFYHQDVKVIEVPSGEVRDGKEAQRAAIIKWQDSVKEIHDSGTRSICSDEESQISTVESYMDVTFKDGKRVKLNEVAIQLWEEEMIIAEKFYYNVPS